MALAITLNIIFALATLTAVVGGHAWVIATQHRAQLRTSIAVVRPRRQPLAQRRLRASRSRSRGVYAA
jgi:hypothetical protein